MHFAVGNISNPLDAIKRVGKHLQNTLTDTNIVKILSESDIHFSKSQIADIFTHSIRMHFAVKNISDPLDAIKRWTMGEMSSPRGNFSDLIKKYRIKAA